MFNKIPLDTEYCGVIILLLLLLYYLLLSTFRIYANA